MKNIVIVRNYDDSAPVVLGEVRCTLKVDFAETRKYINDCWESFIASEPNVDNEFIKFLVHTGNFEEVPDEEQTNDVIVG